MAKFVFFVIMSMTVVLTVKCQSNTDNKKFQSDLANNLKKSLPGLVQNITQNYNNINTNNRTDILSSVTLDSVSKLIKSIAQKNGAGYSGDPYSMQVKQPSTNYSSMQPLVDEVVIFSANGLLYGLRGLLTPVILLLEALLFLVQVLLNVLIWVVNALLATLLNNVGLSDTDRALVPLLKSLQGTINDLLDSVDDLLDHLSLYSAKNGQLHQTHNRRKRSVIAGFTDFLYRLITFPFRAIYFAVTFPFQVIYEILAVPAKIILVPIRSFAWSLRSFFRAILTFI